MLVLLAFTLWNKFNQFFSFLNPSLKRHVSSKFKQLCISLTTLSGTISVEQVEMSFFSFQSSTWHRSVEQIQVKIRFVYLRDTIFFFSLSSSLLALDLTWLAPSVNLKYHNRQCPTQFWQKNFRTSQNQYPLQGRILNVSFIR